MVSQEKVYIVWEKSQAMPALDLGVHLKWKNEVKTVPYGLETQMEDIDPGLAAILVMITYFKEKQDALFLLADESPFWEWMLPIEGRVVLTLSDHSDFTSALAVLFGSYYVFNIEYPQEADTSLEFSQRFFIRINQEQNKCAFKVQVSRRSGKLVQRKNESLNPHVALFIRDFIDYDWQKS
ncbi:uncharacterized protein V6R79_014881 [Siganus canaliculatus]